MSALIDRRLVGYLNSEPAELSDRQYKPARALRAGSAIGLFSPSEPVGGGRVDRLARNLDALKGAGYRIVEASNCRRITAYTAGTVDERLSDIHELVSRADVDALLSTWGGKQCNELLEGLDYDLIGQAQKPIISFSDGCVLLNAITATTGLFTFHGPNVAGKFDESKHSDLRFLTRSHASEERNVFGRTAPDSWTCLRPGTATGRLMGGNLDTFVLGLLGTRFLDITEPVIFFWESMGDPPQIINQYLTSLVNAGWFDRVAAMVVGDLMFDPLATGTEWKSRDPLEAVLTAVEKFSFPVVSCPTFGHRSIENPIVPIGAKCAINVEAGAARLLDAVVS